MNLNIVNYTPTPTDPRTLRRVHEMARAIGCVNPLERVIFDAQAFVCNRHFTPFKFLPKTTCTT